MIYREIANFVLNHENKITEILAKWTCSRPGNDEKYTYEISVRKGEMKST
jgi:hypothetical protein